MVLAGPGSGKTMVIIHRVQHLIQSGVSPEHILVITFARSAARQMRARFQFLTGGRYDGVTFGTFHAVFFQILRYAYHYPPDSVLREEERFQILSGLAESMRLETDDRKELVNDLSSEISLVRTSGIRPEDYYASSCPEEDFCRIIREYDLQKQRMGKIDFDDMCRYTADLFHFRRDILKNWHDRYRYILIDEFQDINSQQYDIMRQLAAPENNLFIVGDDDQSIYRFRGSRPEIMLNFPKDYPDARVMSLYENYRSAGCIVEASVRIIEKNKNRFRKNLRSVSGRGVPVQVLECRDPREECMYVAEKIRVALASGTRPEQIAVLARTNLQLRGPAEKLTEIGIPVKLRDSAPLLYDHFIARDFLAYLRLSEDRGTRSDFLGICNRPNRYISRNAVEAGSYRGRSRSASDTESYYGRSRSASDAESYYGRSRSASEAAEGKIRVSLRALAAYYQDKPWMEDRIFQMQRDLQRISSMKAYAAIQYIRSGIGYDEFLKEYAEKRRMNLEDLIETEEEIQESAKPFFSGEAWEKHIEEYRSRMEELRREKQEKTDGDREKSAVTLSTFHSAKGLEFREVFLLDINEDIVPYKKALSPDQIEEERRLLYVGMTRAEEKLCLLYARQQYGRKMQPSRFLKDLSP